MGRSKKPSQQTPVSKDAVKSVKEGKVKKNKSQKFKMTPSGKVPLINGKPNGDTKPQKPLKSPQTSPESKKNQKKKTKLPKKKEEPKKEEMEEDSDDSDINEGISLAEDISNLEESDSNASSEDETPNILGESLANSSDEDDDDFEASDDDDDEEEVNKGVKKFKGSKQITPKESSSDDDDSDDDNEAESDDDDSDNDEEMSDDDESLEKNVSSTLDESLNTSATTEESSDDDDDDDDDDEEEEEEDGPGLKDLLGESLVDQDDDQDFEGEIESDEDDDEDLSEDEEESDDEKDMNVSSDSSRFVPTEGNPLLTDEEKVEQDSRTIFIGNVPKDLEEKVLKETFKKYGPIQSLRVRGCIPEDPKMKLKVANIKKKFHPLSKTLCIYIVYKSKDSVDKALAFNGEKLGGNYLRVDRIGKERPGDPKKTVFLGNVPFDVQDNDLWELFSKCGKVDYVRTIRDRSTGCCRGIAYINFVEQDGATLALNLNNTTLKKREIRVTPYDPKRQNTSGQKRPHPGKIEKESKKQKTDVERATENSLNAQKRKDKKNKGSPKSTNSSPGFQGQKADGKKKGKGKKFDKKKRQVAAKLLAPKKFKTSQ